MIGEERERATKREERSIARSTSFFLLPSFFDLSPSPSTSLQPLFSALSLQIGNISQFRIPASSIASAVAKATKEAAATSSSAGAAAAKGAAAAAAKDASEKPSDAAGVEPDDVEVELVWWYRPEEARGGRKQFHGEREVFKSHHTDVVHAVSLDGKGFFLFLFFVFGFFFFFFFLFDERKNKTKLTLLSFSLSLFISPGPAKVFTLASYQSLDRVKPGQYYWRFHYLPDTKEFKPEKVPIFCRCNLPYNPDTFMLMCSRCEDWFHPRCVGMNREGVAAAVASREYACPECLKN